MTAILAEPSHADSPTVEEITHIFCFCDHRFMLCGAFDDTEDFRIWHPDENTCQDCLDIEPYCVRCGCTNTIACEACRKGYAWVFGLDDSIL